MSQVLITESYLLDIADAIRGKTGENNTYTPALMASAITNIPSGGASNIITGTFTTQSTTGAKQNISIPYTGTGYPVHVYIEIKNGIYNSGETGDTHWYNLIQRYAIGMAVISKCFPNLAPTYQNGGNNNIATVILRYKNSTTNATSYSQGSSNMSDIYNSVGGTASSTTACRVVDNKTLSLYIASTSYGFLANTLYQYIIEYSS